MGSTLNITTVVIDNYPEIPKHLSTYLDYIIMTHDPTETITYKKTLYKTYAHVLESYKQFSAIYKDICQNEIDKSALIFDYKQSQYIAERVVGWIDTQTTLPTPLIPTQESEVDHTPL